MIIRFIQENILKEIDKKTIKEEEEQKSEEKNVEIKKEPSIKGNNLESSSFNYDEEKLGENILEISKKNQNIISFIDIDIFLQRIQKKKKYMMIQMIMILY